MTAGTSCGPDGHPVARDAAPALFQFCYDPDEHSIRCIGQ